MILVPEKPLKIINDSHAVSGKDLICETILGFGSQVTNGEGFIEKHPARPGISRSLLNFCGIFFRKHFIENFDS